MSYAIKQILSLSDAMGMELQTSAAVTPEEGDDSFRLAHHIW